MILDPISEWTESVLQELESRIKVLDSPKDHFVGEFMSWGAIRNLRAGLRIQKVQSGNKILRAWLATRLVDIA